MPDPHAARVYLQSKTAEQVVVRLPGSNYQLHLVPGGPIVATPQGRLTGTIRCPVWKVDEVSAGGSYIEPVIGRPRRVQGVVIGTEPATNSVVVEVASSPVVCQLPEEWDASRIPRGCRLGLDVRSGSRLEPVVPASSPAGGPTASAVS